MTDQLFPAATEAYLDGLTLYSGGLDVASVMREARLRTMLAYIHAWAHSRGECRTIWRREALPAIAEYKRHQRFERSGRPQ